MMTTLEVLTPCRMTFVPFVLRRQTRKNSGTQKNGSSTFLWNVETYPTWRKNPKYHHLGFTCRENAKILYHVFIKKTFVNSWIWYFRKTWPWWWQGTNGTHLLSSILRIYATISTNLHVLQYRHFPTDIQQTCGFMLY